MTSNRKESPKSKQKSYADAVTNVPSVLVGKLAKYNRLNMIASVSDVILLTSFVVVP